MNELFRVKPKWSTSHLFFPTLIAWVLAVLAVILIVQRVLKCKREGTPFFNFKNYHFFEPGFDKIKFFCSILLLAGYFACLEPLGFLAASIIFLFLFSVLFSDGISFKALFHKGEGAIVNGKQLLISAAIAVVASTFIWWLFGIVFNITLP